MSGVRRRGLVLLAGLQPLLAGCGGLLPKPPERKMYRLSPAVDMRGRFAQVGVQLLVATPSAAAEIDTKRIALTRGATSFDYFADSEWVDRPPFLIRAALTEAFERTRALPGVSSEGLGLNADFVLNTELRDFVATYDSADGPPLVKVRADAELITMRGRTIVAEASFRREARAARNDIPDIIAAFDQAAAGVIGDIVTWTLGNPVLSQRRR